MIYNDLLINKNKFNQLLSSYKNNRMQNAYIFHGDNGVGKEAHAIEFFSLINCKDTLEDGSACRDCLSCKKVRSMQHELLTITLPFPKSRNISKNDSSIKALNDKDLDSLTTQLKLKGNNPYYKIELERANTILINSVKDIKKKISLSIPENSYKLHLILNAEKLCFPNQEAANALLKILEEPTDNNFFILITSDLSKIIDTILSRCTSIYFDPIEFEKHYNYLISKKITKENAEIITRISSGNISYSLKISRNFNKQMQTMEKILTSLLSNDLNTWNSIFSPIRNKNTIVEYLNFLSLFIRDVSNHQNNIMQNINFSNFKQLVLDFSSTKIINFEDSIESINTTLNNIYANGYIPLMMTGLFIELQNIFIDRSTTSKNLKNIEYH